MRYFYLYVSALIASIAGMLSGYDTGVISRALLYINNDIHTTAATTGLIVSAVSIGAVVGAILNSFLVEKIGRKKTFIFCASLFIIGSILSYFCQNIIELITSRLIIGLATGVVSFLGPLYISEISTKEKRGTLVSFYQLSLTFGILFSYVINFLCSTLENNWRIMLSFGVFPALILLVGMLFLKDTPRFLIKQNKIDEATKLLNKLDDSQDINEIIKDIQTVLKEKTKFVLTKKLIKPFIVGLGIMALQVATGINAIIYYTPTIFKMTSNQSDSIALISTIFIGVINFLMTFVAIALVDKIGRKPLLYIGLSGMLIGTIGLSSVFHFSFYTQYLAIIFITLYIISFSMSMGPIALLLTAEVFPLKYRGYAMSSAVVANFATNFVVTAAFPVMLEIIGISSSFLIFAVIIVLTMFFVHYVVPETKGVSLEELEKNF